jgi:DNA repair protein RAD50
LLTGGDKGKSFVHDPKIAGLPEVKASIKLRFQNTGGQEMVVVRSLQLTQKKTLSTFKTLDGVIKMTNSDGKRVAMSHKCGELDKQVPILMGVSKAILENVIFCHQVFKLTLYS